MTLDQLAAEIGCARIVNNAWTIGLLLGFFLGILPVAALQLAEWLSKRWQP
jgi:hypothetical protein